MLRVRAVTLVAVLALASACDSRNPLEPAAAPAPFLGCNVVVPIELGQTVDGSLGPGDCRLIDGSFVDLYELRLTAARDVSITLNSAAFDAYLLLFDRDSTFIAIDNDSGGGTNARIEIHLPASIYVIGANTFSGGESGPYQLRVN